MPGTLGVCLPGAPWDFQSIMGLMAQNYDGLVMNSGVQELSKSRSSEFEKRAADIADLMRTEIAIEFRARLQAELSEEIAVTTENLQKTDAEIAAAADSDAFNLGNVLKLKTQRLELASYLKGLEFCAAKVAKS